MSGNTEVEDAAAVRAGADVIMRALSDGRMADLCRNHLPDAAYLAKQVYLTMLARYEELASCKPELPMRCENCKWWDNSSQAREVEASGACRVNPPGRDKRSGLAVWPFTEDVDWCGSFAPDPLAVQ